MRKIIWGIMVLACLPATSAMESFRDSRGQYQSFRFKMEQGYDGIVFEDASGSFFIQNFQICLKKNKEKIISLEAQNGTEIKGLAEELEGMPEGSKRFSSEKYLSVLKEEGEELERRLKAIDTYEHFFLKILRVIYQSEGREVFSFAVPNFNVLRTKTLQDIPLNSLLVVTGDHGVELIGENCVKLEIKGFPEGLFYQLKSFFQREVMMRAIELYDLKKKLIKKSKKLYEIHKIYSTFNPFFVSETKRLESRIKNVIDEAGGIIEQLEPAWRMTEAIIAFQQEVFGHVSGLAQKQILKSLKGDCSSFSSFVERGGNEDVRKFHEEEESKEGAEKKLEKEELEDDPFLVISAEPSTRKSVLEEGTSFFGGGVSRLRQSGWLSSAPGVKKEEKEPEQEQFSPMPVNQTTQGTWGLVSFLGGYSPFRTSQQQEGQWEILTEPKKKNDEASLRLADIANIINVESSQGF